MMTYPRYLDFPENARWAPEIAAQIKIDLDLKGSCHYPKTVN